MTHRTPLHFPSRQRGAVLVVALLMLLVMTVLGVTAMQMSRTEERMAGNSRDTNLAFQGAEAGLRDGEERIHPLKIQPPTCTAAGCAYYQKDWLAADLRNQLNSWWIANGREYGVAGTQEISDVVRDPRVIIEELGEIRDSVRIDVTTGRIFYRITSSSPGASPSALTDPPMAVLESTYSMRFQ